MACWTPRSHWAKGGKGKGKVGEFLEGYGKNMEKNMENYGKLWETMNHNLLIADKFEGLLYTYGIAECLGDDCDNPFIHTGQPTS